MATPAELNALYLAYFGRPADPAGLAWYAGQPVADVLAAFAGSAESLALYGSSFGPVTVNTIYNNLFNRNASPAEAAAWTAIITAPGGSGPAGAAYLILQNAANDDRVALDHKLAVAAAFTAALDTPAEIAGYRGPGAAQAASAFLKTVDATDASLDAARSQLDTQVAASVSAGAPPPAPAPAPTPAPAPPAPPPPPPPPPPIPLTLGTDTLTGTTGNDTFSADLLPDTNNVLQESLQAGDSIDGGGGNDTLEVTLKGGTIVTPTLNNVGTVVLRGVASGGVLSLASANGTTQATIAGGSAAAAFMHLGGITGIAVGNQTVNASFGGITSPTLAVGLTNVGSAGTPITVALDFGGGSQATTLNLTASNAYAQLTNGSTSVATSVSVAASGTNQLTLTEGATTATSLTITGSGSVDLRGTTLAAVQTLSAGSAGGAIAVNLGTAATAVATGAGNDTINLGSLTSASVIDGGAGDDTVSAALTAGGTVTPSLSRVEHLVLRSTAAGATMSLASSTGLTSVAFANSTASGTVTGMGTVGGIAVSNQSAAASFGDITANALDIALTSVGVGSTLVLDLGSGTPSAATTLRITASNAVAEVKNGSSSVATAISVAATGTNTLQLTDGATTATSLTVTGSGSVAFSGSLSALRTLDAAQATGAITIGLVAGVTAATTGAGNDTVTVFGSLGATASVDLGDGDDTLTLAAAPAAGVALRGGAGTDTLKLTGSIYAALQGFGSADRAKIAGFEALQISGAVAAGSYDASFADASSFQFSSNTFSSFGTRTFNNVASGASFDFQDLSGSAFDLAFNLRNAATSTSDALTLGYYNAANTNRTMTVVAADVESVTFRSSGADATKSITLNLADAALRSLTVTGSSAAGFTAKADMVSLATVDASASTGKLTLRTVNASSITSTGTANADSIGLGGHDTASGHGGNDEFVLQYASTSGALFSTITDFNGGDTLRFGTLVGTETFDTTAVTATGTVLRDWLNAAAAGDGSQNGAVRWFQLGTDTYVVQDHSAAGTFVDGTDTVVKLTGLLALGSATFTSGTGALLMP